MTVLLESFAVRVIEKVLVARGCVMNRVLKVF